MFVVSAIRVVTIYAQPSSKKVVIEFQICSSCKLIYDAKVVVEKTLACQ